jgi:hypothetical protein
MSGFGEDATDASKVIENHAEHLHKLEAKKLSGRHDDLKAYLDYLILHKASK